MRPSVNLLLAAALLGGLATVPAPADALSCLRPPPPEQALAEVDILFTGEAVAQVGDGATRFAVETAHIGAPGDSVIILTGAGPWAYDYEIGTRTIVAARGDDGLYSTGPCPMIEGGPAALRDWLDSR